MRVLFITQGWLDEHNQARVAEVVERYARDPDVAELFFGFTEQTTPGAAFALACAAKARQRSGPTIAGVVPHRLSELRAEARHAIELGDHLLELALGEGRYGYNRYSNSVVELVRDIGQVGIFWDGNEIQEPWDTYRWLRLLAMDPGPPTVIGPFGLVMAPVCFEFYQLRRSTEVPTRVVPDAEMRRKRK